KVQNRMRWTELNDWYNYDRYSMNYNYYYGNYHNPYNTWNYYYNPYCCCHTNNIYSNPKTTGYTYTKPRLFNLSTYSTNSNGTRVYTGMKTGTNGGSSNTTIYNGPRTSSNSSGRTN